MPDRVGPKRQEIRAFCVDERAARQETRGVVEARYERERQETVERKVRLEAYYSQQTPPLGRGSEGSIARRLIRSGDFA